jgi:hypothetical protein
MELMGLDDSSSMILVFDKLDRLVDIMNATRSSKKNVKRPKNCHDINSPSHPHLNELLNIFAIFNDWRLEAGTIRIHLSHSQHMRIYAGSYLQWLVLERHIF